MITLMKAIQIVINALSIVLSLTIGNIIDVQMIFGVAILINACISIAIIFYEKSRNRDRVMSVFHTLLIFMIAQIYTAISAIFACDEFVEWLYKFGAFCLNAIMMGVVFNAYGKFNEENKDR